MDVEAVFVIGLMLSFCTFGTALAFSAVGWWRSAKRVRELEAQVQRSTEALAGDTELAHLAERMEAVEAQLDRVIDGQEFLARVMRRPPGLPATESGPPEGRAGH